MTITYRDGTKEDVQSDWHTLGDSRDKLADKSALVEAARKAAGPGRAAVTITYRDGTKEDVQSDWHTLGETTAAVARAKTKPPGQAVTRHVAGSRSRCTRSGGPANTLDGYSKAHRAKKYGRTCPDGYDHSWENRTA